MQRQTITHAGLIGLPLVLVAQAFQMGSRQGCEGLRAVCRLAPKPHETSCLAMLDRARLPAMNALSRLVQLCLPFENLGGQRRLRIRRLQRVGDLLALFRRQLGRLRQPLGELLLLHKLVRSMKYA